MSEIQTESLKQERAHLKERIAEINRQLHEHRISLIPRPEQLVKQIVLCGSNLNEQHSTVRGLRDATQVLDLTRDPRLKTVQDRIAEHEAEIDRLEAHLAELKTELTTLVKNRCVIAYVLIVIRKHANTSGSGSSITIHEISDISDHAAVHLQRGVSAVRVRFTQDGFVFQIAGGKDKAIHLGKKVEVVVGRHDVIITIVNANSLRWLQEQASFSVRNPSIGCREVTNKPNWLSYDKD